jgi:hypothetical protein
MKREKNGSREGAKRQPCGIAKLLGSRWLHQRVVPTKSHDPAICMMCGERHGSGGAASAAGLPCPELTVMCNEQDGEQDDEREQNAGVDSGLP